ncbi:hypothetical protein MMU07_17275 [Aquiflexum sp. LQ15W]|uniref:hypothetical protein n=1 Tax=Cognataquiflexum nitidum TaxID=2922272 RepID=UPI001F13C535|nr:hypothetical protein [Cognataquiflexum nitidum]MCH6201338.1 hypothetical protein [Cognataquiflexum nitidum]
MVCFIHQDWSETLSKEIINRNPTVDFVVIDRKSKIFLTLWSKFLHKFAILINPLFKQNSTIAAFASNDKTPQVLWKVRQLCRQQKFDAVIAHNLGAFYPAIKVTQWQKSHLQLDVEDFYPGEALYFNKAHETDNRHTIMQFSFRQADNITYASEGIASECQNAYQIPSKVRQSTILNSFPELDFVKPQPKSERIMKCVWFSQHIGSNRGLEQVFEAAKLFPEMEFHLVGNSNSAYLERKEIGNNVKLHPVMPQSELHGFLETMDVGLALENPRADINRDICLTNKILAYAQAGLYILATQTQGQQAFLNSLPYHAGLLLEKDLKDALFKLNPEFLKIEKKTLRWEMAKAFSWEQEQQKLITLLN